MNEYPETHSYIKTVGYTEKVLDSIYEMYDYSPGSNETPIDGLE